DGGGRRAEPRRERHRLAALDRAVRRARRRPPRRRGDRRASGGGAERDGARSSPRRPRPARRREIRGRRPARLPDPRHSGEEEPRGRQGRRPRSRNGSREAIRCCRPRQGERLVAKRRRFSEEAFGETVQRLMDEQGVTYRQLATRTGLSAGYLNHLVHGNRPVPSNDVVKTLATALEVEPEHFREYRLRVITDKLEAMPKVIDRLYRQLGSG